MKKLKFLNILVSLIMVFSMIPFGTLTAAAQSVDPEETETPEQLSKSKTSSRYELSKDKDTTEIALSLPSEEYMDTFDIVFVVDASNESALIEAEASALMRELLDEDLNINVGVIKFKGRPQDTINTVSDGAYKELTPLSDETRSYIEEAIDFNPDTDSRSTAGNGTNTHSPLLLAEKWLDESDTPDDHKYVIFMTDARAYIFDDGSGEPACIYTQYHRAGVGTTRLMYSGMPAVSSNAQGDKYHTTIMGSGYILKDSDLNTEFLSKLVRFGTSAVHSAEEFQLLYDSTNEELTGDSPFQTKCYYVDSGTAKTNTLGVDPILTAPSNYSTYFTNTASLFKTYYQAAQDENGNSVPYTDDPYMELSPLKINPDTGDYLKELNENAWYFHVSSAERALYLTAHVWTDLGEKYHTIGVGNDRGYNSGLETASDFLRWLPENSEMHAAVKDTAALASVFDELENQMIYAVGKAVVTDEVPSYLDLVEDAYDGIPFRVTVDGEAQAVTEIADNDWGFGTAADDVYPYEIQWDADARTFLFYINVPVENAHPVVLNYTLKWNGEGEKDIDVETNVSATIAYCPSDNPNCREPTEEDYESPVVIYKDSVPPTPPGPRPSEDPRCCSLPRTGLGMPRSQKPASVNYKPANMDLLIPSLNLTSKIVMVEAVNGEYPVIWLDGDAGLLADYAMPGEGVSILAGHSTLNSDEFGPFIGIGQMELGDKIFVRSGSGKLLTFTVYANEKIGENDFEALDSIAGRYDSTITLLTCEDELASGGYASRRIICAKQMD